MHGYHFSHQYDCQLSQYDLHLDQLEHGEADSNYTCLIFAALKGIIQKPRDFFIEEFGSHFHETDEKRKESSTSEEKATPFGRPEKQGYDIFLNMVKHTDSLSFKEAMKRLTTAVFLMNCMESVGYLKDSNLKERMFFARLVHDVYNIILSNNHSISFLAGKSSHNEDDVSELKK